MVMEWLLPLKMIIWPLHFLIVNYGVDFHGNIKASNVGGFNAMDIIALITINDGKTCNQWVQ